MHGGENIGLVIRRINVDAAVLVAARRERVVAAAAEPKRHAENEACAPRRIAVHRLFARPLSVPGAV